MHSIIIVYHSVREFSLKLLSSCASDAIKTLDMLSCRCETWEFIELLTTRISRSKNLGISINLKINEYSIYPAPMRCVGFPRLMRYQHATCIVCPVSCIGCRLSGGLRFRRAFFKLNLNALFIEIRLKGSPIPGVINQWVRVSHNKSHLRFYLIRI